MSLLRDPDRHRYDCSAHHRATSDDDTFSGLGTSKEYREEDFRQMFRKAEAPGRPAPDKLRTSRWPSL